MHSPLSLKGDLKQNLLLAALTAPVRESLRPNLELIELKLGDVLYGFGNDREYVYFPTTSILSLLNVTRNGETTEIAVIGNDGLAGISLFMGADETPHQTLVHRAGLSYRLAARFAKNTFGREGQAMAVLLGYMQSLISQMAQTATSIQHRSVEQQLCRRLLLALDRLPSNEIDLTHESLGIMLGVRRETVSEAASKLRQAGVIRYARGRIAVLDREQLEQRAGDGYVIAPRENLNQPARQLAA